jgi:predicted nucleic acid-binding protein
VALLTIDASVAIKWIVEEADSIAARAFLPQSIGGEVVAEHVLISPVFVLLETHYVLAKRLIKGEIVPEQLNSATTLLRQFLSLVALDDQMAREAEAISLSAEAPPRPVTVLQPYNVYDCVYLALAQRFDAALVTADRRQLDVALHLGIKGEFVSG